MKKIIFSIIFVSAFRFSAHTVLAQCDCVPNLTLQKHFQESDAVFVGKVIEAKKADRKTDENYDTVLIKFEVKQNWKRDLEKFVIVKEIYGNTEGFEPNAKWLLYAQRGKDGSLQIFRGCCSRTKPLLIAKKQGDLKAFKQIGEKPKKIIELMESRTNQ